MNPFDFIIHIDEHLQTAITQMGAWVYGLLFAVIFVETGFVVMPFLPGDSLLFAAGTFAGAGYLDYWILAPALFCASVLGDSTNYWVGHTLGPKVFRRKHSRFFKPEYLARTETFYERHGGKTIILARFLPIIRTFAPFVAGVGRMPYRRFLGFALTGAFLWVFGLTALGYFFGNIPAVKEHFEIAIIAIILVSLAPAAYHAIRHQPTKGARTDYRAVSKAVKK